MTWLVTGGAGYIGQHVVRAFAEQGHQVVVLDDLSSGRAELLPAGTELVVASVNDVDAVTDALDRCGATGVVHLAGLKAADESVERPLDYYRVNTAGTVALLEAMQRSGVRTLLFSSSAAVYGDTPSGQVDETAPTVPINPYGSSKLMAERVIRDAAAVNGLSWAALRYFNVAGTRSADLVDHGERNLIPRALRAVRDGHPPTVFGQDYPTRDGSCVRDYIHVEDLASAHLVAAERAAASHLATVYNVGRGTGSTVLEVLAQVLEVTGSDLAPEQAGRRAGDPAEVVADVSRIAADLGWVARHDLASMVSSTWAGMTAARG